MSKAIIVGKTLERLALNAKLRDRLPCLAYHTSTEIRKTPRKGCSSCNKKLEITRIEMDDDTVDALKKCLFEASSDIHSIAKGILEVKTLVFHFVKNNRVTRISI